MREAFLSTARAAGRRTTLPFSRKKEVPLETQPSDRRSPDQPPVEVVNILVVDDRPENLIALEASLKCREYHLLTATSGEEALGVLAKNEVALILLDIQMPGMDGYQTAARIKSDPRTTNIPFMMVTAIFTEDPHIRKGYEAGAVDYIGKPFDIEVLRRKVGIYTQLHQHRLNLRRTADQQKLIDAQLSARREELERRSAEITTLLESMNDPVFIVWENVITESNSAALRLFGFTSYDRMSQNVASFFKGTVPRDAATGLTLQIEGHPYFEAMKGLKSYGQMWIRNVTTGLDHLVRCGAYPVRFRDRILGVVLIHVPLTPPVSAS